jgi:N-ethylmaleimide reductase
MPADLFKPYKLSDLTLSNRMVMAPMTRNRADENGVVSPMMITYYQQRASAGLIITESSPISPEGVGYPFTPGIYTDDQVVSWKKLTDAVHSAGGHVFAQLQHCGRISHPSLLPNDSIPVGPSAVRPTGKAVTYNGMQDYVTPRAIENREIQAVVAQFRHGSEMAKRAGFDGIEVHGANGYIIDQFLRDGSNHRTDGYGGSVQKRLRLLNEILDEVCSVWPSERIGIRFSPENSFNSMLDSDPQTHFRYFFEQLSSRKLAYIHVLEGDMVSKSSKVDYHDLRMRITCPYIANNGYDLERAQNAISCGVADLVAFGIPFLANPDLVRRYKKHLPLNEADKSTFYGGGEAGYVDYPFYFEKQ